MDLSKAVQVFLKDTAVFPSQPFLKTSLIVGVSGGADSLALLHILAGLLAPPQLVVAHLNHGWRDTAVLDAQFVSQTAASWGLTCVVETVDVVAQAKDEGLSLEEAGRRARYRFFARLAQQTGATVVCVAHNADDQAETVLLNLLRGTGLTGLAAMKPVAPLPEAPEVALLRPFLAISRADIEAYCQEHSLTPREDSTNADITFLRNRLRHELLPQLASYNPQIRTHLQQLAALAAADDGYLEQCVSHHWPSLVQEQTETELALNRERWRVLPLALRRRTLRRAMVVLRPFLANIGFAAIEQARQVAETGEVGAQSSLTGGLVLQVDYGRLRLTREPSRFPGDWPQVPDGAVLPLPVPGTIALNDGWQLESVWQEGMDWAQIRHNADPWTAFLAVPEAELWVRGRRPGERFAPLGLNGRTAALKEVMVNRKIGAVWRANWPLVCTAGHVVWLVGHQIDERAKATAVARRVVQLRCYKS